MVAFGTSISTYNKKVAKKPATTLPYQVKPSAATQAIATNPQIRAGDINSLTPPHASSIDVNDLRNGTTVPGGGSQKTAVGGGTAFSASGILGQNAPNMPTFSPTLSGIRQKGNTGMSRLGAINQTSDILNEGMNNRIAARNDFIRRRSAMQNSGGLGGDYTNPTGDAEFFGVGDASGSGLDAEQMANAREIANVGRQYGMNDNAIRIALMTSLTESGLRNLNHGDRDSVGLFQQRSSQGWGSVSQIMNPTYSAGKFYSALKGVGNWQGMSPWQAAQAVQRSFDASGSNYQRQWQLANRGFNALSSMPAVNNKANNAQGFINAYNNKYVDYDGAFGAQCVDLYDAYTARFVGGKVNMVGWAPEIYNNYDTRAYTRFDARQTAGHMGDVAVFNRGGSTPSGHVAIVVGDNGNGTLRVLQANATLAGPAGNTIISNISKSSLMGYLRPNKLMGR